MARVNLDGLLDSAFRIRPGEARQVGLMFLYLMGVVSTFIVGRTVRDTLFLHRVSLDRLPLMYVAVAVAVSATAYVYSRVADKYRRDRLITVSLSAAVVLVFVFWLLMALGLTGTWLYTALYVVIEIIGSISIIQFWTFANDIFSGRQAKRLFGVVGAGGVLANIICGFTIGSIAPILGSENLLLVCAGLFLGCILAVRAVAKKARTDLELAIRKPKKARIGIASDSGTVLHSKHLKIIAGIVVLTFLTVTVIDFQFKIIAKQAFTGEGELAAYFGYFYGYTGIIASVMQFFVTGRLLERSGIVVALSLLPIAMTMGAIGILMVPLISAITAATIAKGSENIFRYTVNDATTQLLYVPVPSHLRGRAKAFIDGILKPASIGVAGLVLFGLGRVIGAERLALELAWLDLVILAGWLGLVIGIRREYVKSLLDTLHARRLDLSGPWSPLVDDATVRTLRTRLSSNDEEAVLHALELVHAIDADFQKELGALLHHNSRDIRILAVKHIGASGRFDNATAIHALMSDPAPEVRAAAIGAFCAIGRERAIRAAAPFLSDREVSVRAAAVAALVKHGGLDGILTAAETLKSFLTSQDPQERLHGARVLAEIKVRNFFQPVLELLQDRDASVRLAAVEAAGEMLSRELVPSLIYKLGDTRIGPAAARALVGYGRDIEPILFKVLDNRSEDIVIRRQIPRILGRIGEQEAVDHLLENLDSPDPELRATIARAAARIRERSPRVRVDDTVLDAAIRTEVGDAYQALAIIEDLHLEEDALLPEALWARHRAKLGLAFRLLEIRYPARTIQLVYTNLDAENKAVRANALEVVDNMLSKDESRLLLPLLDDHGTVEKMRRGAELFSIERHPPEAWLARLLDDPHRWIVACTLHLIGERKIAALEGAVKKHLESRDALVREIACLTLAELLSLKGPRSPEFSQEAEELRRLAARVAEDHSVEVRRASATLLAALV